MKLKDQNGNMMMIILVVLVLMAAAGIYFTQGLRLNKQSILQDAYKVKSDMGANHGLTILLKDVANYYKTKGDISTPTGFAERNKYLPDLATKDIQIDYVYEVNGTNTQTTTSYELKQRTKTSDINYRFYDMIPSISEQFEVAKDNTTEDLNITDGTSKILSGQIAITGVSNSTDSMSTFFIVANDSTSKTLNIYSMNALLDANKSINLITPISILDLYKLKDIFSNKDSITLDNQIKAQAIYNPGDTSTNIYIAITDKANESIDIFVVDVDNVYAPRYITTLDTAPVDLESSEYTMDFSGAYFYDGFNNKDGIFIVTSRATGVVNNADVKIYECYPKDAVPDIVQKGNTLSLGYKPANLSLSVIWDLAMTGPPIEPDIYISVVSSDKLTANMYKFIAANFTIQNDDIMNQVQCGNMDIVPFYIDQIKLLTVYHTLNGVKAHVLIGNSKDSKIFSYYKDIGVVGNWSNTKINFATDEGVGRISCAVVKHYTRGANEFKILSVTPTPILKHVTIVNEPTAPNITTSSFIKTTTEVSKSNMRPKISIEYMEEDAEGSRKIEKVNVLESNINQ
ncbi:MAG TPA: hypothetical protein DEP72_00065 [Clostridiales bacterium]|nr:MAG: hypothetical protein A2Y18_08395 [Clostridiales bacterium GWD2_32_19]HCC06546.1 hypothetical protein [Clostridiales bacterium]